MAQQRILITGISGLLAAHLARELETSEDVGYIAGVDLNEPPIDLARTEYIRADIRSPLIHRVLASTRVDTVIHTDLKSSQLGAGRSAQKEQNVIGAMQLLAACQRIDAIRRVVVRSSTAVYGNEPGDPSILREEWSERSHASKGYGKDVADAETFARDFGRRRPDVVVTVLRMANVVGPSIRTNMTQFFSLPLIPTGIGYDPRLQLLHETDAINVLVASAIEDHPGVFNVAADGVIYLSQAVRIARRLPAPILVALAAGLGDVLRRSGLVDFPTDQISLLQHGRVVDNSRLKHVFGYRPTFTTLEAFKDFIGSVDSEGSNAVVEWEKELYGWIARAGAPARPHLVAGGLGGVAAANRSDQRAPEAANPLKKDRGRA